MPRWNRERNEMTILSFLMSNNPLCYILGFALLGVIIGVDDLVQIGNGEFSETRE